MGVSEETRQMLSEEFFREHPEAGRKIDMNKTQTLRGLVKEWRQAADGINTSVGVPEQIADSLACERTLLDCADELDALADEMEARLKPMPKGLVWTLADDQAVLEIDVRREIIGEKE